MRGIVGEVDLGERGVGARPRLTIDQAGQREREGHRLIDGHARVLEAHVILAVVIVCFAPVLDRVLALFVLVLLAGDPLLEMNPSAGVSVVVSLLALFVLFPAH